MAHNDDSESCNSIATTITTSNDDSLLSNGEHQSSIVPGTNHQNNNNKLPIATVDVHKGQPVRLQVKVQVPSEDHPNYNFVGKLLGPKGNSLKWLQERTQTKMAILGKGSMRNKDKEEELRRTQHPRFSHLNENLHVEITAIAPAPEAYLRISKALFEVKRFLVPDYFDDIRQQQLRELGVITDYDHHHLPTLSMSNDNINEGKRSTMVDKNGSQQEYSLNNSKRCVGHFPRLSCSQTGLCSQTALPKESFTNRSICQTNKFESIHHRQNHLPKKNYDSSSTKQLLRMTNENLVSTNQLSYRSKPYYIKSSSSNSNWI